MPSKTRAPRKEMRRYRFGRKAWTAWFSDPVYSANIYLLWPVGDEKVLNKFIESMWGPGFDEAPGTFGGKCVDIVDKDGVQNNLIVLWTWDNSPEAVSALSHECGHCTENILFSAGMKHTKATREAFAYLQDSLVRRCLEILRKK